MIVLAFHIFYKSDYFDDNLRYCYLNNIGRILEIRGEMDKALKHYREALEIAKQLGSPNAEIIKKKYQIFNETKKE